MLRFQSARDLLPAHPAKAVEALDGALDRADQAIAEGRDAIQNLRSSTTVSNELAQAITSLAEELTNGPEKGSATFRMSVEGSPRELHPIVRDDIHRIAREALRNAFRHAQADHIEAEVTYGARELRVRIRDDGKGIDPQHLSAGTCDDTGDWRACASAPCRSARNSICGAKWELARNWSCAFRASSRMVQPEAVAACFGCSASWEADHECRAAHGKRPLATA